MSVHTALSRHGVRRYSATMPRLPRGRLERLREVVDRLHPSGLLYATYEHRLIAELDANRRPQHVAVLADGNRRWARANAPGQPLVAGYQAGRGQAEGVRRVVRRAGASRWSRSGCCPPTTSSAAAAEEIGPLLDVIESMVTDLAAARRWRIHPVGALDLLPPDTAAAMKAADGQTADIDGMVVNIAVSYGGRHELRDAVRSLLAEHARNGTSIEEVAQTLDIDHIAEHLYTRGQPDPDLIIRTSGEQRLSGFLMWQSAHSEFYFCEALWPDFRKVDFIRALRAYAERERRFGG